MTERKPQETKLAGSLNLTLTGIHSGSLPIRLTIDDNLTKLIQSLLGKLGTGGSETNIFACKGANNKLGEVTVIASIGDDYSKIRCPRLHEELNYFRKGFDTLQYPTPCCYEGDDLQNVPVVSEEDFAANNIFKCPYAKLR